MAGCFGGSAEDRHFQKQLDNYLDPCDHHQFCPCHEDNVNDVEYDDGGNPIEPICDCDALKKDDEVEAQLTRLGM